MGTFAGADVAADNLPHVNAFKCLLFAGVMDAEAVAVADRDSR